jgi:outer membrane biogenesis lipoprotein LolB
MKSIAVLCLLALLLGGCATVPFQKTELTPLAEEDPRNLVERFQARNADSFQLLTSVVFEYNWRKFSGLGYVDINARDRAFKVVCLNPLGVKLFEFSGDRNGVVTHYSIADFSKYGDVAAVVGNDIRRIYFDLVPSPEALVWKRKYRVSFRQAYDQGFLEYVFAGQKGDLIEKNYYDDSGIVWQVSYYEYYDQKGNRFPRGIVFQHYQYGYRLIVRHKEFRS